MPSQLRANVYIAPPTPYSKPDGTEGGLWSPISSTLIHGDKEAVLVDTPITQKQNEELAKWIEETIPTKKLVKIYITHGHADHWLGINYLQQRFLGVKAVATPGTIAHMKEQIEPAALKAGWGTQFPNQIDTNFALADPLPPSGEFYIEGNVLRAVEVGHSDTHDSTILWVPSIRVAVCGDVVYGDVHMMLRIANTKALREEWIRAIEKVEALGPETVVAGHQKAGELHGTWNLKSSKEYIRAFGEIVEGGGIQGWRDVFKAMKERFPTRYNDGALIAGCVGSFPSKKKGAKM